MLPTTPQLGLVTQAKLLKVTDQGPDIGSPLSPLTCAAWLSVHTDSTRLSTELPQELKAPWTQAQEARGGHLLSIKGDSESHRL